MTHPAAGPDRPADFPCPRPDHRTDASGRDRGADAWRPGKPGSALHAIRRMPDVPTPRFVPDSALL